MSQHDPENASWLRPLPEEFANEGLYKKRKMLLVGLSAVVLLGFAGMIWASYTSEVDEGGPVPVVRADNSIVKEKPDDPGGKEIPFQDREVFDRVDNLPQENDDVLAASSEIPLKRPVAETIEPAEEATEEEVEVAEETAQETPETKPAPPPAPVGDFMVQVGAFADKAKAETHWNQVKSKNSSALANLNPTYMRVDLGARGVLYRVRGGMIANRSAADNICDAIKKNNQSCMVVTK
ncbi:SPOR domain-containing protein [Pseudemcibacter aquimaris]|uniref:SPOR domain-containing protein n=1 Tax=Pseudemcibacter aquimaris TaxID=2857064 RepID=UPI002010DB33|nr:SPOR domain-containing protein [Pseudemcibacter aquimaris]MCC3860530.1 SPOR domain-containing protein [Pseudemcibacter aquimaris]WDU59355.1 SPOR domain-containing protein [Pseudemcibacter aquimaris]